MKLIDCKACGSKELYEELGYQVCAFCRSKYVPQEDDKPNKTTDIGVSSDVLELLRKCELDPSNRGRYINLILDLDPTNKDVLKYL